MTATTTDHPHCRHPVITRPLSAGPQVPTHSHPLFYSPVYLGIAFSIVARHSIATSAREKVHKEKENLELYAMTLVSFQ